jgi:hypothetical protein
MRKRQKIMWQGQGREEDEQVIADLRYSLYCPVARCKPLRFFVFVLARVIVSRLSLSSRAEGEEKEK